MTTCRLAESTGGVAVGEVGGGDAASFFFFRGGGVDRSSSASDRISLRGEGHGDGGMGIGGDPVGFQ